MNTQHKIILLFPDGVGIRNYLYSDVFKGFEKNLILFHSFDSQTETAVKEITNIEKSFRIPKYKESIKEKFCREWIALVRLQHNAELVKNLTLLRNWKTNHRNLKNKLFYKIIGLCAKGITDYKQITWLEKKYQSTIRTTKFYNQVQAILKEVQPSHVFCLHQRGIECAAIFAAAADLEIKTTTVIYSWDNLPKARMALKADQYLVWSPYMRDELHLYYPEIKPDQIFVTGTPQFECYHEPKNIIPKDTFYARYNLDKGKKIICFSGDDVLTSPDDPHYLNDLANELVRSGLSATHQILLRRCPVDISGRFEIIVSKYPDLIKQATPLWNFEPNSSWTTIYPLPEDVSLLVSTAYYSDVVVNVGSTMAFDFAMFEKPCIYINYDQENKVNPHWSVETIYKFQHFRSMPNKDCVIWWNKKHEMPNLLNSLAFKQSMNYWKTIVLGEFENTSKNIKCRLK